MKKKAIWFIAAGIVFGMACLTNSIIQFFIIFIIINFLILNRKGGLKKISIKLVWFILAFALFVSPWVINNYINYGRTPFLSKSGLLLAMRAEKMHNIQGKYIQHLIANTTGDFFAQKIFPDYDRKEARLGMDNILELNNMIEQGVDQKEVDAIMRNRGIKDIKKHPIKPIEKAIRKIGTGLGKQENLKYIQGGSIRTSKGGRIQYEPKGKNIFLRSYTPNHGYA